MDRFEKIVLGLLTVFLIQFHHHELLRMRSLY
jgi:hypothetical protein